MVAIDRAGKDQNRSQQLPLNLHVCNMGPRTQAIFFAFLGLSVETWIGTGAAATQNGAHIEYLHYGCSLIHNVIMLALGPNHLSHNLLPPMEYINKKLGLGV